MRFSSHAGAACLGLIAIIATATAEAADEKEIEQVASALRKLVIDGSASGKRPTVFVDLAGRVTRARLASADESGIVVEAMGGRFPIRWKDISPVRFGSLAAKFTRSGRGQLRVARYYALKGMAGPAEQACGRALELDPKLGEKVRETLALLPRPKAPPVTQAPRAGRKGPPADKGKTRGTSVPKMKRQLRDAHPRLLVEDLAALRAANRGRPIFQAMKAYCDNADGYTSTESFALAYLISRERKYFDGAWKRLEPIVNGGAITDLNRSFPSLSDAAVVFDWCYDALTDAQKQKIVKWINLEYDAMKAQYRPYLYHNYAMKAAVSFMSCGYATHGDNPRAMEILKEGRDERFMKRILPGMSKALRGGAWAEGSGYGHTTILELVHGCWVMRTAEGIDVFNGKGRPFLLPRLRMQMLSILPAKRKPHWLVNRGDGTRHGHAPQELGTRLMLMKAYRDRPEAQWAAALIKATGQARSPYRSGLNWDVLWRDATIPSKSLDGMPPFHYSAGMGVVLARSDWTEQATHVTFLCGDHESYHQHLDQGSFTIFRYNDLAVDAGDYKGTLNSHALDFYMRTIAHNTLLIHDPREKFKPRRRDGANDGGQAYSGGNEAHWETGNMLACENTARYTYACGDFTAAYRKGKVRTVRRHFLFLRPNTVIVHDRVIASKPEFKKTWLLHGMKRFELTGSRYRLENAPGRLTAWTLHPETAVTKVVSEQGGFRLEVSPSTAAADTTFLHVLVADKAGDPEPPAPERLDANGVRLRGGIEVRFNASGAGGTIRIGGKSVKLATRIAAP